MPRKLAITFKTELKGTPHWLEICTILDIYWTFINKISNFGPINLNICPILEISSQCGVPFTRHYNDKIPNFFLPSATISSNAKMRLKELSRISASSMVLQYSGMTLANSLRVSRSSRMFDVFVVMRSMYSLSMGYNSNASTKNYIGFWTFQLLYLVHVSHALGLYERVLLGRVARGRDWGPWGHQLGEGGQQALDPGLGHLDELPGQEGLAGLGAHCRGQENLKCEIN